MADRFLSVLEKKRVLKKIKPTGKTAIRATRCKDGWYVVCEEIFVIKTKKELLKYIKAMDMTPKHNIQLENGTKVIIAY